MKKVDLYDDKTIFIIGIIIIVFIFSFGFLIGRFLRSGELAAVRTELDAVKTELVTQGELASKRAGLLAEREQAIKKLKSVLDAELVAYRSLTESIEKRQKALEIRQGLHVEDGELLDDSLQRIRQLRKE